MADLTDLNAPSLACDRAIFTSIPSPTGEGYRLVTWSGGVRVEERMEITRRAPSHGATCPQTAPTRGLIVGNLPVSGRALFGLVKVAGAEHTRRGGSRVWTEYFLADAAEARRAGLHPVWVQRALDEQPPPKKPLEGNPLSLVNVVRGVSTDAPSRDARGVAMATAAAWLLLDGRVCVAACGPASVTVFEDALHMIPAAMRAGLQACAGLRFSSSRAVTATFSDAIDPDTVRSTRGQGVECVDLVSKAPPVVGPLEPWLTLMARWWSEGRGGEASDLAGRMVGNWSMADVLEVASLAEAMDRQDSSVEAIDAAIDRRAAA